MSYCFPLLIHCYLYQLINQYVCSMVPCLFTCMFQVQYYLMDFDEILYEHVPNPVLFNLYRICDNKNIADTQKCEV